MQPAKSDDNRAPEPPSWPAALRRAIVTGCTIAGRFTTDLLTPPVCAACQKRLATPDALCAACWRDVHFIRQPLCDRLGIPLPYVAPATALDADASGQKIVSAAALADPPLYDRARAVAEFGPVVKRLVHTFKYHDQHHARRLFGRWMADSGGDLLDGADVLIPVPLHRWRLIARRFNQAAILAQEVSRLSGLPVDAVSLVRVKRTKQQAQLSATERQLNVRGAFRVPKSMVGRIKGRRVVLIEDVITTGATVGACARALRAAGAANVDVLAIAISTRE